MSTRYSDHHGVCRVVLTPNYTHSFKFLHGAINILKKSVLAFVEYQVLIGKIISVTVISIFFY